MANADGSYSHPPLQMTPRALGKRKSFVGTPCWMAPEVIAQKQYDASADIWSVGITALELCNGRAPHSRDSPAKVLQKILHQAPPTLDRKGGQHQYSKELKEIIESCLVKDPTQRPTAAQLLEMPYFRSAKRKSYLISALIGQFSSNIVHCFSLTSPQRVFHRSQIVKKGASNLPWPPSPLPAHGTFHQPTI